MALDCASPRENLPTLDEYEDEPSPMPVSYCSRLTEEEYEAQTSAETERAIEDLIGLMEKNPELYRRVLQRRRREEMENGSFISYLKARALYFWQKDSAFDVPDEECQTKTKELQSEMTRVFHYSQGLREQRGCRKSTRLAEKRKSAQLAEKRLAHGKNSAKSPVPSLAVSFPKKSKKSPLAEWMTSTPPPPPPAPPMPDFLSQFTDVQHRQPIASQRLTTSECASSKVLTSYHCRAQTEPACASSHDELMGALKNSTGKRNLRRVKCDRSPGGTPVKTSKQRRPVDGGELSLFNTQLLYKFRNANLRSPSPPVHDASSWFSSPES